MGFNLMIVDTDDTEVDSKIWDSCIRDEFDRKFYQMCIESKATRSCDCLDTYWWLEMAFKIIDFPLLCGELSKFARENNLTREQSDRYGHLLLMANQLKNKWITCSY